MRPNTPFFPQTGDINYDKCHTNRQQHWKTSPLTPYRVRLVRTQALRFQERHMCTMTLQALGKTRAECRQLISRRAPLSAAAAVVPVPGVDVGTDVAILTKVIPIINARFGLTASDVDALSPELKKLVVVGGTSMGLGLVGRVLSTDRIINILVRLGAKKLAGKYGAKYVPLIGSAISASISFVVLRKVGNQHIEECYEIARRLALETQRREAVHTIDGSEEGLIREIRG